MEQWSALTRAEKHASRAEKPVTDAPGGKHLAGARSGEEERGQELSFPCLGVSVVKITFRFLVVKIRANESTG